MNPDESKKTCGPRQFLLVCALLVLATCAAYWRVYQFSFVNYDDFYIVVGNSYVHSGFTWEGFWWSWTTSYYEYWHPIMWWSHMLDCQLFGQQAGWHHVVNLGLHCANSVLVLIILRRMTGRLWRSAMVAGLFALHPLHVESVAWVAERKDLLSAFFGLLAVLAYVSYAQRASGRGATGDTHQSPSPPRSGGEARLVAPKPGEGGGEEAVKISPLPNPLPTPFVVGRGNQRSVSSESVTARRFYMLSLFFFVLGLMTKPMVVTLPFVLVLLDYWPLNRLGTWREVLAQLRRGQDGKRGAAAAILMEKVPFFALTVVSCFVTWLSVKLGDHLRDPGEFPWSLRLANMFVSYARYLGKTIVPVKLAALYPMPKVQWDPALITGSVLVVVVVSVLVWWQLEKRRYLAVGWCIFLGMLVPTIGLIPVGIQSMADRYMYLPSIGVFIAVVWWVAEWVAGRGTAMRVGVVAAAVVILAACGVGTMRQTSHWRNSESLWTHCLEMGQESAIAHYNLGSVYLEKGLNDQALEQYQAALELKPDFAEANLNYGAALTMAGRFDDATNYYGIALRLKPDYAEAMMNLGLALIALNKPEEAVPQMAEAIRLQPQNPSAYVDMGRAMSAQGKSDEAINYYLMALQLNSASSEAHMALGQEYLKAGRYDDALQSLDQAAQFDPEAIEPIVQSAIAYGGTRRPAEAVEKYRQALKLSPDAPDVLNNLAWLLATWPEAKYRDGAAAVSLARRACELTKYQKTQLVGTLATAYAEAGDFDNAVATSQKACDLAAAHGEEEFLAKNKELLELFKQHQPYHEPEKSAN